METLRITQNGKTSRYIAHCQRILTATPQTRITITAAGRAVTKAIIVAEVVKTSVEGVQSTASVSEEMISGRWISSITLQVGKNVIAAQDKPKLSKRKLEALI